MLTSYGYSIFAKRVQIGTTYLSLVDFAIVVCCLAIESANALRSRRLGSVGHVTRALKRLTYKLIFTSCNSEVHASYLISCHKAQSHLRVNDLSLARRHVEEGSIEQARLIDKASVLS